MPVLHYPIPEVNESVIRPAITDIINQLIKITGIDPNVNIRYPGETGKSQQPGTAIDSVSKELLLTNGEFIFIEVDQSTDENMFGTSAIYQKEHFPIFADAKLNVTIRPVYLQTQFNISIRYKTISKTNAIRWRDNMIIKLSSYRDINLHDITYHYSVPDVYLDVLNIVYDMREAVAGYNESLFEYLQNNSSERMTIVGDIVGKNRQIVISETQDRIVGMFDFSVEPDKIEKEDDGTFTIALNYKLGFQRPISAAMHYPIMIHNQLVPEILVKHLTQYDEDRIRKSFSTSLGAMNYFESQNSLFSVKQATNIIRIPEQDFFIPKAKIPGIEPFLSVLSSVDTDNRTLFSIHDLGDVNIDPDILTFIAESEYPYITRFYQSILNIALYRNDSLARDDYLQMSSDGVLYTSEDMSLRNMHRCRFGLTIDISLLTKPALERLKLYPRALLKVLASLNEMLPGLPIYRDLLRRKKLAYQDLQDLYAVLYGQLNTANSRLTGKDQYMMMLEAILGRTARSFTVMTTSTIAHRLSQRNS